MELEPIEKAFLMALVKKSAIQALEISKDENLSPNYREMYRQDTIKRFTLYKKLKQGD